MLIYQLFIKIILVIQNNLRKASACALSRLIASYRINLTIWGKTLNFRIDLIVENFQQKPKK